MASWHPAQINSDSLYLCLLTLCIHIAFRVHQIDGNGFLAEAESAPAELLMVPFGSDVAEQQYLGGILADEAALQNPGQSRVPERDEFVTFAAQIWHDRIQSEQWQIDAGGLRFLFFIELLSQHLTPAQIYNFEERDFFAYEQLQAENDVRPGGFGVQVWVAHDLIGVGLIEQPQQLLVGANGVFWICA